MKISGSLRVILGGLSVMACYAQPEPLASRILRMSETEQIAYTNSVLDRGLPTDEIDALSALILHRSSLVLPIVEKKIEEVLKSPSPAECFTSKAVDAQKFVDSAAALIAYAGDPPALKEAAKLVAVDERRFGILVNNTLVGTLNRRNSFTVAYSGFEIGNPAVDARIAAWIELQFANKAELWQDRLKHLWAEAMIEKYGGIPTESNWASDPIASRLTPELAQSLQFDVLHLALETWEKGGRK